ncbi:MAG: HslU--HslV peptidase proteolytic subunit, partial [Epsilonproteobacteria bacterium]|nr:HslU--HslV peptidase proteolytic subunit [Campylobacterota bacterium]
LDRHATLDEETLVKESLKIASELCIYTNDRIKTFVLESKEA